MEIKVREKSYRIPWEFVLAPFLVLIILLILLLTSGALHRETPVGYASSGSVKELSTEAPATPTEGALPQPTVEASPVPDITGQPKTTAGKVNINKAGLEELMSLPYIGEVKARAILDYRNTHGPFKSIDELENIKGIGPKTLEKLRPLVTVE